MDNISELIGLKKNDPKVSSFVRSLGVCTDTDSFGGLSVLDYPAQGLSLNFDEDDVLVTAFLYMEGYEEYSQFRGAMPHHCSFSDTRVIILAKFGTPEKSGPTWDRFAFSRHLIHFQYSSEETILMITVMAPSSDNIDQTKNNKDENLVITPVPALCLLLLNLEKEKGSPLTEVEVIEARDKAVCIALRLSVAKEMEEKRGYRDLNLAGR